MMGSLHLVVVWIKYVNREKLMIWCPKHASHEVLVIIIFPRQCTHADIIILLSACRPIAQGYEHSFLLILVLWLCVYFKAAHGLILCFHELGS